MARQMAHPPSPILQLVGFVLLLVSLTTAVACQESYGTPGSDPLDAGNITLADGGATNPADAATSDASPTLDPPPPASQDPCERVVPGSAGTKEPVVALSAAHASIRWFGTETSHEKMDGALVKAMRHLQPWSLGALSLYAKETGVACALTASNTPLGPVEMEVRESAVFIKPGTGDFSLPENATALVVDLRGLPESPELPDALQQLTRKTLGPDLGMPRARVRVHSGMTDEVYGPLMGMTNTYSNEIKDVDQPAWAGNGGSDLAVVVLTGPRLAPSAARFAATIRLANRAWLAGEDVMVAVAEMKWVAVGSLGLTHRDRLLVDHAPWPDVVPADIRSQTPESHVQALVARGAPSNLQRGACSRVEFLPFPDSLSIQPAGHGAAETVAALVVAHGAARTFFPYFHVVGDTLDPALVTETTAAFNQGAMDPDHEWKSLARWSWHLHDSHSFVWDLARNLPPRSGGYMPILLDQGEAGEAIIRRSSNPELAAGEVVEQIRGQSMAEAMNEQKTFISASTPGAQVRDALARLSWISEDTVLQVRGVNGQSRAWTVSVAQTVSSKDRLDMSSRTHGFLADMGSPDTYYVNLDARYFKEPMTAESVMREAQSAKAMILDGRGYPGTVETWWLAQRILSQSFNITFLEPEVSTLTSSRTRLEQPWQPLGAPRFDGPVAVLIGPTTQSQAEHILMALKAEKRARFFGRQTAGANGNITGVMLPAGYGFTFTGLEVLFPDGSTFHGKGIQPDVMVWPTPGNLAGNRDPELDAALAWILE